MQREMSRAGDSRLQEHIDKLRAWLIGQGRVDPDTLTKPNPRPLPALPLCM